MVKSVTPYHPIPLASGVLYDRTQFSPPDNTRRMTNIPVTFHLGKFIDVSCIKQGCRTDEQLNEPSKADAPPPPLANFSDCDTVTIMLHWLSRSNLKERSMRLHFSSKEKMSTDRSMKGGLRVYERVRDTLLLICRPLVPSL